MRLSDIRGERTFEVLADLIDPVSNIVSDEEVKGKIVRDSDAEKVKGGLKEAGKALLKSHRDDAIAILATLSGQTVEEYVDGLSLISLTKDLMECITDRDLIDFFTSLA